MQANPTILQMKYARIILLIAEMKKISEEEAMDIFYNSKTFYMVSNGIADMHCRSDQYIADEICMEQNVGKRK